MGHFATLRFGTVALSSRTPMLSAVNLAGPTPCPPERDLASRGIGLVASTGEAAKSAEALLRRRYSWAEAEEAQTLVALGGDGFMLQTLHAMLEDGEARGSILNDDIQIVNKTTIRYVDDTGTGGPDRL